MLAFLSPAWLWLLLSLPAIVALHFLRQRRLRHEASALFLWQRATQTASLRRRVRPTWLLLLQLLFAGLAVLALARPALVPADAPDRVVVIDASASMAAVGPSGSRVDAARQVARELSRGAGRVALVRAGALATLMAPLDADAAEREAALAGLAVGDAAADVSVALDLAAALLPGAEVHVVTDQQLSLGAATVHVVGEEEAFNVGVSAFTVGVGQVFVGVVSSDPRPTQVRVVLERDGEPLASSDVLVPVDGVGTATFPLQDLSGVVAARLDGPSDALALDDVAYAGARPVSVVTDDTHGAVTRALTAVPSTEVRYSRGAASVRADLRALTAGQRPEDGLPYVSFAPPVAEPVYAVVRDFDRAHPLLRFADLSDAVVGLDPDLTPWPEEPGWRVLARTADLTPVIRVRQDGPLALELAFHPSQTDLTLRPAFPALFANVVAALGTTASVRLGEAVGAGGPWLEPGVYEDGQGRLVLASLLSAGESRLPRAGSATAVRDEPYAAADGAAQAAVRPGAAGGGDPTPLATALAVAALAALVAEQVLRRAVTT